MVKSTVIIITKPPYGHENAYGALYTAIAGQETTLPSTIVLVGDGVYCALKNQTSEDTIRYPSIEKLFHTLSAGTEILVEETSLVERKIPKESIIDIAKIANEEETFKTILKAQAILTY